MTTSKTYNMMAGMNYIETSDIVFTDIYAVKREGLQYDKFSSGAPNRRYSYSASQGRIYFSIPANTGGEKVFVIYKKTSTVPEPIPGVCVGVTLLDFVLPDAIIGILYSKAFFLGGSPPYSLTINDKPDWMTIQISGSLVLLTGTPDTEATETIDISVSNCDAAFSDSFTQDIEVTNADPNFYVRNQATAGVTITQVTGINYVIQTGSFPIHYPLEVVGVHGVVSGIIKVKVAGIVFPQTLRVSKNGVEQDTKSVTSDGQKSFSPFPFVASDQIEIVLN